MGAGESGTGTAILGKKQGWDVFVSDLGSIAEGYKSELRAHDVAFEEKTHTEVLILNADCIVKSPGPGLFLLPVFSLNTWYNWRAKCVKVLTGAN